MQQDDLYCKIFVAGPSSRGGLVETVAAAVRGTKVGTRTVENSAALVDVNLNDVDTSTVGADEAFLAYPFALDVEPADGADRADYVRTVGSLLSQLWRSEYKAVASCDFEAELPYHGGYLDGRLTFPTS